MDNDEKDDNHSTRRCCECPNAAAAVGCDAMQWSLLLVACCGRCWHDQCGMLVCVAVVDDVRFARCGGTQTIVPWGMSRLGKKAAWQFSCPHYRS